MRFFIIFLLSFSILPVLEARAQGHSQYCSQADSTAATQNCLKRHLDAAQSRLNKIYTNLSDGLEAEQKEELKELQKSWLRYRDAECMWEAERSMNAPLKRINELSCMARVTEDRADILAIASNSDEKAQGVREYGSFPRWMNVVAKDYPDIFWNYGTRTAYDLDCDGEDEYVMQGVRINNIKSAEELDESEVLPQNYETEYVISVTQNLSTGRPASKIFTFLVSDDETPETICSPTPKLKFMAALEIEKEENGKESPSCGAKLEIQSLGCSYKTIIWNESDFALEAIEVEEEEINEDKE